MAKLNINGKVRDVQAEPDTPLLWVIREQVGLTGTKYGCGVAQCGACSVHINGEVQRSCSMPLSAVKASDKIVTIEGLSANSSHPVQKAWVAVDVPQCGYCQSGQIMAAAALLKKKPKPTDADIDEAMTNICRCGTYQRIREAVHQAAGNGTRAPPIARAPVVRESSHEKNDLRQRPEALPPHVRRRRGGRRQPARSRSASSAVHQRKRTAQNGATEAEHLGRYQAGRHLCYPHCPLRNGSGHPHRPRPARRRRT